MPLYTPNQVVQIGSNTAGVTANISTGTMILAGGSNVTLSQNAGNAITIHGAAGGGGATLSGWALPQGGGAGVGNNFPLQLTAGNMMVYGMKLPMHLSCNEYRMLVSKASSSNAQSYTLSIGVYTKTGSTLNLLHSAARTYGVVAAAGNVSSYSGVRGFECNTVRGSFSNNSTLYTPGHYYVGVVWRTSGVYQMTQCANQVFNGVYCGDIIDSVTNSTSFGVSGITQGWDDHIVPAIYSSTNVTTLPATIHQTNLGAAGNANFIQYMFMGTV